MNNFRKAVLSFFLIAGFFIKASLAQEAHADIIYALNSTIKPIRHIQPVEDFSDVDFLSTILKGKMIVALGEATHGTREIFSFKDRMIRLMVKDLNYKAIAFESDFTAVEYLDAYINHQADTISYMGGFPLFKETRTMLSWLRSYNAAQSPENRVHLYGLEARGYRNIATRLLEAFNNNLTEETKRNLNKLISTPHNEIDRNTITKMNLDFAELYAQANAAPGQQHLYKHYVELLEQELTRTTLKAWRSRFQYRDQYMANNAQWILNKSDHKRLILWAHNGHISKSALYKTKSMGTILHEQYKDQYYAIATDFDHGEVSVFVKDKGTNRLKANYFPEVISANAYEYYFKQAKFDNFFLEVNQSPQTLKQLLEKRLDMRMIGGTAKPSFKKLSIADNFDLIAFIKKSSWN